MTMHGFYWASPMRLESLFWEPEDGSTGIDVTADTARLTLVYEQVNAALSNEPVTVVIIGYECGFCGARLVPSTLPDDTTEPYPGEVYVHPGEPCLVDV